MSTPLPTERDDPGSPIRSVDELVAFFRSAEKPASAFRVGTEHEKIGFLRPKTSGGKHLPLPFDGPDGIEALLRTIAHDAQEAKTGRWVEANDSGRTIALFRQDDALGDASITLEPGGQFELSGAPVRTIHETCDEVGRHLALLRRICLPRGIGFIGMGFHPTARWDELPLVPKSRYAVMQRYMPHVGARGLDMMKRTATVQANYDWSSERFMVESYRATLAISPLVAALFAASPFVEGRPSGALSERQRVWADTDPHRAGYPACVFEEDFSYEKYVEWVLSVPMYFVRRDGIHHDVAGASFRTFMTAGLLGHRATMRDFSDHLTTLFPEVRVKRVLEVRSADCGPWTRICALPALHKGILYDDAARAATYALMDGPTSQELSDLRADVAMRGYSALYRGKPILPLCQALLDIARDGLVRQHAMNRRGEDESVYLEPLRASVASGETFAEKLLRNFNGPWQGDIEKLWAEVEFFDDNLAHRLQGPCA